MKTKLWVILLTLLCTLITSTAQILWKFGAKKISLDFYLLITNYPLIIGFILYFLGSILLMMAFKGGDLSFLYPLFALSYIWISILSPKFFPTDSMSLVKWFGIFFIIMGVSLVGIGGNKHAN